MFLGFEIGCLECQDPGERRRGGVLGEERMRRKNLCEACGGKWMLRRNIESRAGETIGRGQLGREEESEEQLGFACSASREKSARL